MLLADIEAKTRPEEEKTFHGVEVILLTPPTLNQRLADDTKGLWFN